MIYRTSLFFLACSQDIVAIIHDTNKLKDSDDNFALGGSNTYKRERNDKWRGFEPMSQGYESFYVNCAARPTPGSCPVALATAASEGKSID